MFVLASTDTGEPNVNDLGRFHAGSGSNASPESVTLIVKLVVVRVPGVNLSVGLKWTFRTAVVTCS